MKEIPPRNGQRATSGPFGNETLRPNSKPGAHKPDIINEAASFNSWPVSMVPLINSKELRIALELYRFMNGKAISQPPNRTSTQPIAYEN